MKSKNKNVSKQAILLGVGDELSREQLGSIKIILAELESALITFARQLAVEEHNAGVLGIGTQETKYRTLSNGGQKGEGYTQRRAKSAQKRGNNENQK